MKILERVADMLFPLMLYTPIYFTFILLKYHVIVSLFGAFFGSVALMLLASAVDDKLYIRRSRRELREFYK